MYFCVCERCTWKMTHVAMRTYIGENWKLSIHYFCKSADAREEGDPFSGTGPGPQGTSGKCSGWPDSLLLHDDCQFAHPGSLCWLFQGRESKLVCSASWQASCLVTDTSAIRTVVPQLKEFFSTLGLIQRDAVWWVHTVLPKFLRPQPTDYKSCLRKVLFLEPTESYHEKDSWPPESDRVVRAKEEQ